MAAMQFGKAYGLTAQEATAQMATLALASTTRVPDLAVSRAVQLQAERAGIAVLPPAGFAQAATQISTVGGTALLPQSQEFYNRMEAFLPLIYGQRANLNPAGAFAQYAGGLTGEQSTIGQVMQMQAIEAQRRVNPLVTIGEQTYNLNRVTDAMAARSQLPLSPVLQQRVFEQAQRFAGGSEEALRMNVMEGFGLQNMAQAIQMVEGVRKAGSIEAFFAQRPDVAGAQREQAAEVQRQLTEPGGAIEKARSALEEFSDAAWIKSLVEKRNELYDTIGDVSRNMRTWDDVVKALTGSFQDMQTSIESINKFLGFLAGPFGFFQFGQGSMPVPESRAEQNLEELARRQQARQPQTTR
jgi:hypothetical protein